MPLNKMYMTLGDALDDILSGCTILVSGFGGAGCPSFLLDHLASRSLHDLTVVANNAGLDGRDGLSGLLAAGAVRRMVCSYPRTAGATVFADLYQRGDIELDLVPQGTLSERIRAAGAGIGGFYTRTGVGTALTRGRETRTIAGEKYVLEYPLHADYALIGALKADRWGNLVYDKSGRNFGPTMAMAAAVTIAQVTEIVSLGSLDPEVIVTPGVFIDRVVEVGG